MGLLIIGKDVFSNILEYLSLEDVIRLSLSCIKLHNLLNKQSELFSIFLSYNRTKTDSLLKDRKIWDLICTYQKGFNCYQCWRLVNFRTCIKSPLGLPYCSIACLTLKTRHEQPLPLPVPPRNDECRRRHCFCDRRHASDVATSGIYTTRNLLNKEKANVP